MCNRALYAVLIVLTVVLVAAVIGLAGCWASGAQRDGYLVYPYLDLDEPGERGNYYALGECP